jgi:hypothetical protein
LERSGDMGVRRCILPLPIGWLRGEEPSDLLPQEDPTVGILLPCPDEYPFHALAEAITARCGVSASHGTRRRPVFCSDLALQPRKADFSSQRRYAHRQHLARRPELGGPSATGRDSSSIRFVSLYTNANRNTPGGCLEGLVQPLSPQGSREPTPRLQHRLGQP